MEAPLSALSLVTFDDFLHHQYYLMYPWRLMKRADNLSKLKAPIGKTVDFWGSFPTLQILTLSDPCRPDLQSLRASIWQVNQLSYQQEP